MGESTNSAVLVVTFVDRVGALTSVSMWRMKSRVECMYLVMLYSVSLQGRYVAVLYFGVFSTH